MAEKARGSQKIFIAAFRGERQDQMSWIKDLLDPKARLWENFYRNRWQHDRVVRSTHGVNCTGGCSWMVYVKEGIVTWELQATDYPRLDPDLPPHEPRGCQRGITSSWYIYSPLRVKYPYIRGGLFDLWRAAREEHADPVEAWGSVVENTEGRKSYQGTRGKGGFRRTSWEEVLEIIAASIIYTAKKYGPDRVFGFSPIPAMSMLSYAAGSRFLQLFGAPVLSFYDWYADFPPASPEVWGEKTDVSESADWYNSKYIVIMGSNLNMTRTPDAHFAIEARNNGTKLVVMSPDFSQVSKHADWWLSVRAGQDGAFWMAVNHVILKEYYVDRTVPYFTDYIKRFSDCPFLVEIVETDEGFACGRFLPAVSVSHYRHAENAEWKFLVVDSKSGKPRMPHGSIGYRWQKKSGQWNLMMKDGIDGSDIDPLLTLLERSDDILEVAMKDFTTGKISKRGVPVKYISTDKGKTPAATVFDLLLMQHGVSRGLPGEYPGGYDDDTSYTPAWQEKKTGLGREAVIRFAREWASTAEKTKGKCTIIVGSGTNHWFHSNLHYRAGITGLILCGCVGVNGGGLNHYTGQEKITPESSWSTVAFAHDWIKPPRLQNAPSFHYVHSDQWRYESEVMGPHPRHGEGFFGREHTMDHQVNSVRLGWLPFYPQFNRNSLSLADEAKKAGAKSDREVIEWVVRQLKEKKLRFAVEDPDAPENWPRVWLIWRGNALMASAKGHEYFLKHYLGTHTNTISEEKARDAVHEAEWRDPAPEGKLDLVVDLNFRMDTSALYSDIVLPAANWYEKEDLNTTDMHSFIHPFSSAVPPCWESKTDWEIFRLLAEKAGELSLSHFPGPVKDIVATPLLHDSPDEIAQREVKDWHTGECEPVPGKTMPHISIVERDYGNLHNMFVSLGHAVKRDGISTHGINWPVDDIHDDLLKNSPSRKWGGSRYISLFDAREAAEVVLAFAPETNGEISYRGFRGEEEKTGLSLAKLAEKYRGVKYGFADLVSRPGRILTSPCWSGITNEGRAYAAYTINTEYLLPWRTLTGRQHLYLDHEGYLAFGEHLPTFKGKLDPRTSTDIVKSLSEGKALILNYLTPHGKWHIHSTFSDTLPMMTLSRGIEPFWLNTHDAEDIGVKDNDWVELYNDHGVVVTRASVSARIPRGAGILYHAPERTVSVPKSPERRFRRAGGHNSLVKIRLKPLFMVGGYAQFSYGFNYWGPPSAERDSYIFVHKLEGEPKW
jgi:nitrate reductase alpha subunit